MTKSNGSSPAGGGKATPAVTPAPAAPPALTPQFGILFSDSGTGKCLIGSTEVLLADGRLERIDRLVKANRPVELPALASDLKLRMVRAVRFFEQGRKDVYCLRTQTGKRVDATEGHPFFTAQGWKPLYALKAGEMIASPRALPCFGGVDAPEHEVKMLAHHLADGECFRGTVRRSTQDPTRFEDWKAAVLAFGGVEVRTAPNDSSSHRVVGIGTRHGDRLPNPVRDFLRDCGLDNHRSPTKFVPERVFSWRRPLVALFLSRYLGCDGAYEQRGAISFSSASERLLRQVSHLLLRFGVRGSIRERTVGGRQYWEWHCGDADCVETFRREIGLFSKEVPVQVRQQASHNDLLPLTNREVFPMSLRGDRARLSRQLDNRVSRASAAAYADIGDEIHRLAHSDLYWEEVQSIRPHGRYQKQFVYDIEVEGLHNFIANDLIVHNSAACAAAFPHGVFVGPRNGVAAPARSVLGFTPYHEEVATLEQVEKMLDRLEKMNIDALVIDDLSILSGTSFRHAEDDAPVGRTGNVDGWYAHNYVADQLPRFRDRCRALPFHVLLNAHPRSAWVEKKTGTPWKGRPDLPGNQAPKTFPPACDFVIRVVTEARGAAPQPLMGAAGSALAGSPTGGSSLLRPYWPAWMQINPYDPDWFTKDRNDTPDGMPLNIGEMLRAAGYTPRRAPGMEWVDEVLEQVVTPLLQGAAENEVVAWVDQQTLRHLPGCVWLQPGDEWKIIRWVRSDLYARVTIRKAKAARAAEFSGMVPPKTGGAIPPQQGSLRL